MRRTLIITVEAEDTETLNRLVECASQDRIKGGRYQVINVTVSKEQKDKQHGRKESKQTGSAIRG